MKMTDVLGITEDDMVRVRLLAKRGRAWWTASRELYRAVRVVVGVADPTDADRAEFAAGNAADAIAAALNRAGEEVLKGGLADVVEKLREIRKNGGMPMMMAESPARPLSDPRDWPAIRRVRQALVDAQAQGNLEAVRELGADLEALGGWEAIPVEGREPWVGMPGKNGE